MATNLGHFGWRLDVDDDGERNYTIKFKVKALPTDGPLDVTQAPGLPQWGASWDYGNAVDQWALRTSNVKVYQFEVEDEKNIIWVVEVIFSTKPLLTVGTNPGETTSPLARPDIISGSFVSGTIDAHRDKDGNLIRTTSFEPVQVQFDSNLAEVQIDQNVINLNLPLLTSLMNKVNNNTMWGLTKRKIKLSNVRWERRLYTSNFWYYNRKLHFDINFDTFDRSDIPNKGKKFIKGDWDDNGDVWTPKPGANPNNPRDYERIQDYKGNNTDYFLSSSGAPSTAPTFLDTVEYYKEDNLFRLGVPLTV